MRETACPLCGHTGRILIWSQNDQEFLPRLRLTARLRTHVCTRCGLAYTSPKLDERETDELYRKFYRPEGAISDEHIHSHEREAEKRVLWLTERYQQAGAKLLEIGCSEGIMLRRLRDDFGFTVRGVEPFAPYAEHGIKHWGLSVEKTFFPAPAINEKFDVVASMHVIEHLHQPAAFLSEIGMVLKPNGYVFLETPNLWAPRRGRIGAAHFPAPHLQIFSPRSISLSLKQAGFEPLSILCEFSYLRIFARFTGRPQEIPAAGAESLRHACLIALRYYSWFLQEHFLLARRKIVGYASSVARRALSPEGYDRVRKLYRVI